MRIMRHVAAWRGWLATAAGLCVLLRVPQTIAQDAAQAAAPKRATKILYILPNYLSYLGLSDSAFASEVTRLRQRLGEGTYVRVGFTVYIFVDENDWRVDTTSRTAVHAALASTIAYIDKAIARARANNIPICMSILMPSRERYDPVERDAETEDRRNMQWYMDNGLANGWVSHSRYARKYQTVLEAYVREIGRVLADRMRRYPATLVAASGDGEVELSYARSPPVDPAYTEATSQLADYSPFAVAEFRDWLRNAGLYASGQPFAGQGYAQVARYAGDASPGVDTNGDGHTLNGDAGTNFSTWDLRYFDWSLSDSIAADPHAIPAFVYNAPGWNPNPDAGASRFDAPRVRQPGNSWWELWDLFRQTMIWRHNLDFARWITTSPDDTGATVPTERWYSHQIPADYLFGSRPDAPILRLATSASPEWTADITPYGAYGITSFNINAGVTFYYTTRNVAPVIGQRGVKWGILEWNPSTPASDSLAVYDEEMAVMQQYQPSLLVPIFWRGEVPGMFVENTGFEFALQNFINRVKNGPQATQTMTPIVPLRFAKPGDVTPSRPVGLGALQQPARTSR